MFLASGDTVSPFEFRALTGLDVEAAGVAVKQRRQNRPDAGGTDQATGNHAAGVAHRDRLIDAGFDYGEREGSLRTAVETARREALQRGEQEGRRASRAEMEAEMRVALTRERQRLAAAVAEFLEVRERYFVEVEQEVVKLALAIAARVLHREAQVDPLLLTGVVRVALEKMADRSGVVLRVAAVDVEAWEQVFSGTEVSERPMVMEAARLERGDCVLETRMGTVELGVSVQLEEIEKGFFDLLNHRPVK
jgi:flagellar assembly protein FliH